MTTCRNELPQLSNHLFLTDGGLETTLIFNIGITQAAQSRGIPVVIGVTVETDGKLPTEILNIKPDRKAHQFTFSATGA